MPKKEIYEVKFHKWLQNTLFNRLFKKESGDKLFMSLLIC